MEELFAHFDPQLTIQLELLVLVADEEPHALAKLCVPRQAPAHELKSKEHQTLKIILVARLLAFESS